MCSFTSNELKDLSLKSREAEKEVDKLHLKIQEVNDNSIKMRKDMDCKFDFEF